MKSHDFPRISTNLVFIYRDFLASSHWKPFLAYLLKYKLTGL